LSSDPFINDSNDHVFEGLPQFPGKHYAIIGTNRSESEVLIRLINYFGEKNGFQRMIKRLKDKKNVCPVQIAYKIIEIVGQLHYQLYRKFALSFLPGFIDVSLKYFLESENQTMRKLTKKMLVSVVDIFDKLIKRCYSLGEKYEMIENF